MNNKTSKPIKPSELDLAKLKFDIHNPVLPDEIKKQAMKSGGYPYDDRMKRKKYERELVNLQIELSKLQNWVLRHGERIIILFEGRDAAGKGGTIKRFMQHLNLRHSHVVALSKPSDIERGQWYFQRYIQHFPTAGDITFFDRSWYNRAGVERVLGFCSSEEVDRFLDEVPSFEAGLVREGFRFFKFWLTIGREMQLKRFHDRRHSRLRRWKLSEIDIMSIPKWDDYTVARQDIFRFSCTTDAPWTIVRSNDKRRARLNTMRVILSAIDYEGKNRDIVGQPDDKIVDSDLNFLDDA